MPSASHSGPLSIHRRLIPESHRVDVIKFQQSARRATMSGGADKRALPTVSLPHRMGNSVRASLAAWDAGVPRLFLPAPSRLHPPDRVGDLHHLQRVAAHLDVAPDRGDVAVEID